MRGSNKAVARFGTHSKQKVDVRVAGIGGNGRRVRGVGVGVVTLIGISSSRLAAETRQSLKMSLPKNKTSPSTKRANLAKAKDAKPRVLTGDSANRTFVRTAYVCRVHPGKRKPGPRTASTDFVGTCQ